MSQDNTGRNVGATHKISVSTPPAASQIIISKQCEGMTRNASTMIKTRLCLQASFPPGLGLEVHYETKHTQSKLIPTVGETQVTVYL